MDSKNNLNVTIRDSCYIPNNPFSSNLPVERISISKSSTEGAVSYEMENHLDQASFSGSCFLSCDQSYLFGMVLRWNSCIHTYVYQW